MYSYLKLLPVLVFNSRTGENIFLVLDPKEVNLDGIPTKDAGKS